ncbi:phenylacetate-coenzyme A ligase [Planctomycetales bacterium]|nr:phenylacetate-coenzyme A ligase [Planctomycetales bacterium]
MARYFNEAAETMPLSDIRKLQEERFQKVLRWAWNSNSVCKQKFALAGITKEEQLPPLSRIDELPLLSKEDFRLNYPLGLCCIPKEEIREMHMSSGSTGTAVVMPYNEHDLDQWAECMARCWIMSGAEAGDPVQITPSFGLFNGGFGMYHGARKAGMFVIPTGSGNTERQIRLAKDLGTKVFGAVVSYMVRIMEMLDSGEIKKLPELKIGVFGAESFSDGMKRKIESALGIEVFDIYGMTETGGVGTLGMDCKAHSGIHVWEDQYYCEVIDPVTKKVLPDGEQGELVVTALNRQALPVIRFKTGDLTKIVSREKCSCGRTHIRISSIAGRTDDMLIVKGVNFFPLQVEHALMEIPGVLPQYQIIIEEVNGVRDVSVNVEAEESVTGYMVEKHLKERLGFSPKGDVFKPGTLPRSEGKAKRVIFKNN